MLKLQRSLYSFLLYMLFFFSGISALIYQTVWIRKFGLVFGVDVFAASTVITAFMAGLALGNLLIGRLVDKKKNPLLLFVLLEGGIALFAFLFPYSFRILDTLYLRANEALAFGFYGTQIVKFIFAFFYLLIPTTLMGGTLPVLSKALIRSMDLLGRQVGTLYSFNNLGALVGCFLAGFYLMRLVGLSNSIFLAAALNTLNAIVAFLIRPMSDKEPVEKPGQEEVVTSSERYLSPAVTRFILWAFALEGFAALAYEVIWTRILVGFSYDKSVYFYTTVIFTFIFGLFLGSLIIARVLDRKRDLLLLFATLEAAIGVLAIAVLTLFSQIAGLLSSWRLNYSENWWTSLGREYLLFFAAMALPSMLMGMTFPVVSKICTTQMQRLGRRLGEIGFLDTVGSIAGAFASGFILIPLLGVIRSVILAATLNLVIAVITIILHPDRRALSKISFIAVTALATAAALAVLPGKHYFQHWQTRRPSDRLLYYHEGADATIAVPQHSDGIKFLAINGSVTAFANYGDTRVHKMLGYLPWLLHEKPQKSLVIGLGMGITAQSLMLPGMERVDCVEINRGVVEAAALQFAEENGNVLNEQRLNLIIDDGRSYLHATDEKYDIITSNAVHARLSGNLYTKEFYEICREHLTPDGVMCQWTSTNWLSADEFRSLIAAFRSVFPHTSLWLVNAGHLLMIGTEEPLHIQYSQFASRLNLPKVRSDLGDYSMILPAQFLAHFVCDGEAVDDFIKGAPVNTDDHPVAELSHVVSKMQIPEILLDLIKHKVDLVSKLYFDEQRLDEMVEIKSSVTNYAVAEKYYLEGVVARNILNQPLLALNMITEALRLQPDDYRYREEAASLNLFLAQQPDFDASKVAVFLDNAIEHLTVMTTSHPNFAYDWTNLGFVYMNRGHLEEAKSCFDKAISLEPDYPLPRLYLASIIGGQGYLDDAEKLLREAINTFPGELEGWYRLAIVYELKGEKQQALTAYRTIVKNDPTYRDAAKRLKRLQTSG